MKTLPVPGSKNPFSRLTFVSRTSLLLVTLFGLDKVLAFARSIIIARRFTLSAELDAFNAANNLPDLLFALISGGALAMAFIPILTEHITQKSRADAWALFSRIANLAFLATASLAVLVAIFAKPIASSVIVPGFGPEQQALVASLMRMNLIATIIFSISGLVAAGLQANQYFLLPALAPVMYNIGQIFGALVLVPIFGVYGLVYGVIIGSVMHLAIQIPGLVKYQFHWTAELTIRDEGVREMLKVAGPRLLTMFMIQMMFILRDNFASRLDQTGAVSALTYGWMIMQVPETLLGTTIATALLPTLAEYASSGEWVKFRDAIERAMRVMVALTLPVAGIGIVVLGPLVKVVFGFDATGSAMLTHTTQVYMLTLTGYVLQELMARSFYARKEATVPLKSVIIRLIIYVVIAGLAAAEFSLTVEALVLFSWLNRRVEKPITAWGSLFRGGLAAIVAGGAAYGLLILLPLPVALAAVLAAILAGLVSVPLILPYLRLTLKL
jgi:putative peptidoglycan lipid II flippase